MCSRFSQAMTSNAVMSWDGLNMSAKERTYDHDLTGWRQRTLAATSESHWALRKPPTRQHTAVTEAHDGAVGRTARGEYELAGSENEPEVKPGNQRGGSACILSETRKTSGLSKAASGLAQAPKANDWQTASSSRNKAQEKQRNNQPQQSSNWARPGA